MTPISNWHLDRLEIMAVVLVFMSWSAQTTVVAFINHQGGLRFLPLYKPASRLLWAQRNLRSVRVVHVQDFLNEGADSTPGQSKQYSAPLVRRMWTFLRQKRTLPQPNLLFKGNGRTGSEVAVSATLCLLLQVISWIREEACAVLLVAPVTVSNSLGEIFSPKQEGHYSTPNQSCGTCVFGPLMGASSLFAGSHENNLRGKGPLHKASLLPEPLVPSLENRPC